MHRYERERDWRNQDYRRSGSDDEQSLLERIKNDVKAWFSSDDDYESAGRESRADYVGNRGSQRRFWNQDEDRSGSSGNHGVRSSSGRNFGPSRRDASSDSGYRGRFDESSGRSYEGRYAGESGRGFESQFSRDSSQSYDRRYERDDDTDYGDYRRESRGTEAGSGSRRQLPFVLYSEYWVTPGPYSGVGPKGYERSPDALKERVCERLEGHGELDASEIEVTCDKDEVTLTGTVNSRREKRLAEECAEGVYGVQDVHNHLSVKRQMQGEYAAGSAFTESASKEPGTVTKSPKH